MLTKNTTFKKLSFIPKLGTFKMLFIIMLYSINTQAQDIPFNCDYNAYLFQYNDVYALDLASGNSYLAAENVTPGNINAAAYNPADGFIWGALQSPSKTIVRVGKDFKVSTFYLEALPATGLYIGDVSVEGYYYLKGSGAAFYKIDLDSTFSDFFLDINEYSLSQDISMHDWAFNAVDNQLYTVEKKTNILYRINPVNGKVTALGEVPVLSGLNYTYGAVYFDNEGRFYVSANQTGTIYMIRAVQDIVQGGNINSNFFAFGPSSASNDGARCPTAPVPQEICDNGLDDDGDGLIDCEDPSCSGFGECEVFEAPTSGSNSGGLESNSRLSDKINKRNFNRAKTGYKFNIEQAKRITKTDNYGSSYSRSAGIRLEDFIPLNSIGEDEAIEASPSDLVDITNATEVYSVDYLRDNSAVASVLALKTESGVYEHTKYICDRLLGAELLSVSTIAINGHSFIKSVVKNEFGGYEFVLSLSARIDNNESNFAIDSHWCLDQYEKNTSYYNFQVWSKNIDDLYALGEEVLRLLDAKKPVSSYQLSTPPEVFVRKGVYKNGALDLQIINTRAVDSVVLTALFRKTETGPLDSLSRVIPLNNNYITNIKVDTEHLFDIGFRIGNDGATPDDLFMSDGPWGIDDSDSSTKVQHYSISTNDIDFADTDFGVERNVDLLATTSNYVSVYRALTPRFKTIDLSAYNAMKFSAQGTGILEVTIVKEGIQNWNEQYRTYIELSNEENEFVLHVSNFSSPLQKQLELNDAISLVFTMYAETGEIETKSLDLRALRFTNEKAMTTNTFEEDEKIISAFPNPMSTSTSIQFEASNEEMVSLMIFDQLGKIVYQENYKTVVGENIVKLYRQQLIPGVYNVQIASKHNYYKAIILIVQ